MLRALLYLLLPFVAGTFILAAEDALALQKNGGLAPMKGHDWGEYGQPQVIGETGDYAIISTHTPQMEADSLVAWNMKERKARMLLPRRKAWSPEPVAFTVGEKTFVIAESSLLPEVTALWAIDGESLEIGEVCALSPLSSRVSRISSPDAHYALVGVKEDKQATLWRTDGTASGTVCLARDLPHNFLDEALPLNPEGTRWLLFSDRITEGGEPHPGAWISDGTPEGTRYVQNDAMAGYFFGEGVLCESLNGRILALNPRRYESEIDLFSTTGEAKDTRVVTTFKWSERQLREAQMCVMGNAAYILLVDFQRGWDLWRTDGTLPGTTLLKSMEPYKHSRVSMEGLDLNPQMAVLGDRLVFVVDDGDHGEEPWVTDGTPEGCRLLNDCNPGPANCQFELLARKDGRLFFWSMTKDFVERSWRELWLTDGTDRGTIRRIQLLCEEGSTWRMPGTMAAGHLIVPQHKDRPRSVQMWMMPLE